MYNSVCDGCEMEWIVFHMCKLIDDTSIYQWCMYYSMIHVQTDWWYMKFVNDVCITLRTRYMQSFDKCNLVVHVWNNGWHTYHQRYSTSMLGLCASLWVIH